MYNLLISLAISAIAFVAVLPFDLPWYAGVAPAALIFPLAAFLLMRRTGQQVQAAVAPVQEIMMGMQSAKSQGEINARLDEVRAILSSVRDQFGNWQFLLAGQMTAQLGALDYMQLKFDEAYPKLGKAWRDWNSEIMAACILYRKGELDEAWAAFEKSAGTHSKEPTVFVIWATLLSKKGKRTEALAALTKGLETMPDNKQLREMKNKVANKKKLDTKSFQETWFRFFPEEAQQQMMVRGRRGNPMDGPVPVQMRQGPPQPKLRGKMARRR